jgi:hypothetical protein
MRAAKERHAFNNQSKYRSSESFSMGGVGGEPSGEPPATPSGILENMPNDLCAASFPTSSLTSSWPVTGPGRRSWARPRTDRLGPVAPKVCTLLEGAEEDLTAFYLPPSEHWTKLRSQTT